jgi:hypothetical protein
MRFLSTDGWKLQSKLSSVWPRRQAGETKRGLQPTILSARDLGHEQLVEEGMRRQIVLGRQRQELAEDLGPMIQPQGHQRLARLVELELGFDRLAHPATSASAA